MAIDITEVIAEYGAYYRKGSQAVKDIRTQIMQPKETDTLFALQPTESTRLEGGNAQIGAVLQAFQKQFTPMGNTTFGARVIDLHPIKVDWEEYPDVIEQSWLGFLASNNLDRKDWPIVRYILEKLVIPAMDRDWEGAIFSAVKGTVVAGTPLPISQAFNGIKKILNTHIADGETTPVTLGAVPTDPEAFVDYVEAFYKGIPEIVRPYLGPLAMSKTLETRFREGMRKKYNVNYAQATDLAKIIDTNMTVRGFASHSGSGKIWTTIQGNAVLGVKKPANEGIFRVENVDRLVKAFTDFYKGIGFWQPEYIYTNDVELT